jgi:hypothetical protein
VRAFKTLRDFLELLETDKQLLRITDAVSLEPDLAAAGRAVNQAGGETSPALLFSPQMLSRGYLPRRRLTRCVKAGEGAVAPPNSSC